MIMFMKIFLNILNQKKRIFKVILNYIYIQKALKKNLLTILIIFIYIMEKKFV